jgi:hypothetical protein
MFLPAQYAWFEPVLVAALLVFIVDFIGSVIVFSRWSKPGSWSTSLRLVAGTRSHLYRTRVHYEREAQK